MTCALLSVSVYLSLATFVKVICENSSRTFWLNELSLVMASDVDNCLKMESVEALFAALDSCRCGLMRELHNAATQLSFFFSRCCTCSKS